MFLKDYTLKYKKRSKFFKDLHLNLKLTNNETVFLRFFT